MKTRIKNQFKKTLRFLARQHVIWLSLLLVGAIYAGSFYLNLQNAAQVPVPTAKPEISSHDYQEKLQERVLQNIPPDEVHKHARPRLSIIIDDMGVDKIQSARAMALSHPLTLSFLPYASYVQRQVNSAKERGHEIFLHLPLQPEGDAYAGPHVLRPTMNDEDIRAALEQNLSAFTGYAGINNHMGSAFSADERAMRALLMLMKEKNYPYVDSRTTPLTKFDKLCIELHMPCLRRHVFLDHDNSKEAIRKKLDELVLIAHQKGYAIGIGHPYQNTLDLLEEMLPSIATHIDLVPVNGSSRQ